MAKCKTCDGTGYDSAQRRAGMMNWTGPSSMVPLGVWQCESCGGTGEEWQLPKIEFTRAETIRLHRLLKKIQRRRKKDETVL